jgi:2-oxoglutarate dehydrogenase E1 component
MFTVYNSLLSEFAVLGFEYGYAQAIKQGLTIWEAQFGDFANSAQIIIDQYISSSEQKWGIKSPVVMMLPHGYEGGGPEHSSARMERYLQLCAQHNMRVVVPSCSAQVFHVLREQALQKDPCPLILFNPKSMLRFTPSLSSMSEFTEGKFIDIYPDSSNPQAKNILICCGKVYYDLVAARQQLSRPDTAILRIEQLYPLNTQQLHHILQQYPHMERCCFVQEEPENMGAYTFLAPLITEILPDKIKLCYVGRARSASPAAGSLALHQQEKERFIKEAFK